MQFPCRGLLPTGAHFQSREYAEYQDQRSYNAEHDPAASTQHGTAKRFRIGTALGPREVAFSQEALRDWELYDATANKLLAIVPRLRAVGDTNDVYEPRRAGGVKD